MRDQQREFAWKKGGESSGETIGRIAESATALRASGGQKAFGQIQCATFDFSQAISGLQPNRNSHLRQKVAVPWGERDAARA